MKFELTLFQNVIADLKDYPKFGSQNLSMLLIAAESITLLKKPNAILPLNKKKWIAGYTNSMKSLNGGWTYTCKEKMLMFWLQINSRFWKHYRTN
jgi:beta-glucosidase